MPADASPPMDSTRRPASEDTRITVACRNTDATNALLRGRVKTDRFPLRFVENNNVVAMFAGMQRGEYDVSEMSMAEFIHYRSRGEADFIGVPVFPSRVFRHGFIYVNRDAGIASPADLSGKRIGFLRWVQTAFVWVRGTLVDDYGVSREKTRWFVNSMHHWHEGDEEPVSPRDGSTIEVLPEKAGMSEYERICSALAEGELDAIAVTENKQYFDLFAKSPNVTRLFASPRREEADYFRRTGIYPIMHLLVVKEHTLARHPGLARELFALFSESKRLGRAWMAATPSATLAWKDEYIEEERAVLGADPWAFGLAANERVVSKFLDYCHEQGIGASRMAPRDMFTPETWDLAERPATD